MRITDRTFISKKDELTSKPARRARMTIGRAGMTERLQSFSRAGVLKTFERLWEWWHL